MSSLEQSYGDFAAFINGLDAEAEERFELSHAFVIICPDCGQNVAFRGRCPKCGGDSWMPAGHAGGVSARTRVLSWQAQMRDSERNRRNPSHRGLRDVSSVVAAAAVRSASIDSETKILKRRNKG